MAIHSISDPRDPRLHHYRNLTDVALRSLSEPTAGIYIAESAKVITRAVESGHQPLSILMAVNWRERMGVLIETLGGDLPGGVDIFVGEPEILESLTGFHVHRGALAAMKRPEPLTLDECLRNAQRVAVLEGIVDHSNVGAIFRSAAGLGVDAILVSPQCADPLYRRSIRVSMGAVFALPWTRIEGWPDSLTELTARGFTTVAVSPGEDSEPLHEFARNCPERVALILGTEGEGLTAESLARCQKTVHIPMTNGVSSLNVAAASAVVFWALRTQG